MRKHKTAFREQPLSARRTGPKPQKPFHLEVKFTNSAGEEVDLFGRRSGWKLFKAYETRKQADSALEHQQKRWASITTTAKLTPGDHFPVPQFQVRDIRDRPQPNRQ